MTKEKKETKAEELQRFMEAEALCHTGIPFHWWKSKAEAFPRLAAVAKKVLCVQGSSAPAERAFSANGLIVSQQRASLTPANAEGILFLNEIDVFLRGIDLAQEQPNEKGEGEPDSGGDIAAAVVPLPDIPQSWEDF